MHSPITLSFDLIPWSRSCIDVLDKAQEAADFAPVEAVRNFVLSSLIGLATESVVKSLGSVDSDGNPSKASSNTAAVAGFGVGLASDMLTTEVIGSARSLKQSIDSMIQSNLRSMKSGGKHSSTWELPMMNCALYEAKQAEEALVKKHGTKNKIGPAGFEPDTKIDASHDAAYTCDNCHLPCAAMALHRCGTNCPFRTSIDADLQSLFQAWSEIPNHVRQSILALSRLR